MLAPLEVADAVAQVWHEREVASPPRHMPVLPESWPARYEQMAADHGLQTLTFSAAVALADRLWHAMFPTEGT